MGARGLSPHRLQHPVTAAHGQPSWRAREAGIRVGLLSNSWGDGQYDPYAGYDLDGIFDAVVISGDTGTRKPDAAIYLIATDELRVPPRECVFADDTAANLPVAEELGMATVNFTDAAKGIREISRLLGLSLGTLSTTERC